MRELETIRAELDGVDRELVRLFEARMALCREVGEWKRAHGRPVLDAGREEQVLASRAALLREPGLEEQVRELFRLLMAQSRQEQLRLMGEGEEHA